MNNEEKNWINSKINIIESPTHGCGMVALQDIEEGEIVIIWREGYIDKMEAEKAKKQGMEVFQWADDVYSIVTNEMLDAHYVNHSCDPNCWMNGAFSLSAMREIKLGEEITVDYALFHMEDHYVSDWICNCGSPHCREKVTGTDWRDPELQQRYRDHFSPLLNERIRELETVSN